MIFLNPQPVMLKIEPGLCSVSRVRFLSGEARAAATIVSRLINKAACFCYFRWRVSVFSFLHWCALPAWQFCWKQFKASF